MYVACFLSHFCSLMAQQAIHEKRQRFPEYQERAIELFKEMLSLEVRARPHVEFTLSTTNRATTFFGCAGMLGPNLTTFLSSKCIAAVMCFFAS